MLLGKVEEGNHAVLKAVSCFAMVFVDDSHSERLVRNCNKIYVDLGANLRIYIIKMHHEPIGWLHFSKT